MDIPMLLDSGADVTLLPQPAVQRLGVPFEEEGFELVGFDGNRSVAPSVRLNLSLCGKSFKGRYLVLDQEWGIVGRDVLNYLALVFDGPALSWREQNQP